MIGEGEKVCIRGRERTGVSKEMGGGEKNQRAKREVTRDNR